MQTIIAIFACKLITKLCKLFKRNDIKLLYPCHCVFLKAKIEMAKKLDIREVGVGLEIDI